MPSKSEAGSEPSEAEITPAVTESSADATTPAPTDEESATSEKESASPAESPAPAPEGSQAPAAETQQPAIEREKMPQTAGTLPLLALLGVCSLGLAATLRILAKRSPIS